MSTSIKLSDKADITRLISTSKYASLADKDKEIFQACFALSTSMWIGLADDALVCVWGLAPPTLLSETAYLWLYTTDELSGYEFRFIRHSQRMVEEMLNLYPVIVGHTNPNRPRTLVWLKWLGARFGAPNGDMMEFEIRKPNGPR